MGRRGGGWIDIQRFTEIPEVVPLRSPVCRESHHNVESAEFPSFSWLDKSAVSTGALATNKGREERRAIEIFTIPRTGVPFASVCLGRYAKQFPGERGSKTSRTMECLNEAARRSGHPESVTKNNYCILQPINEKTCIHDRV